MKKTALKILLGIAAFTAIVAMLNIEVDTRQGVNYQVQTIKIPLYLKVLDFFDRHYNYGQLVKRIIVGAKTDEERVMKIFSWTYKNIKRAPEGMPIIDDHAWYTIVRGYGVEDQFSDIFTTLCNYSGQEAYYDKVFARNRDTFIYLSFVKLGNQWSLFDPYNGVFFKNHQGGLANITELTSGKWITNISATNTDYKLYLENLSSAKEIGYKRENMQSPLRRILYEIKKRGIKNKNNFK